MHPLPWKLRVLSWQGVVLTRFCFNYASRQRRGTCPSLSQYVSRCEIWNFCLSATIRIEIEKNIKNTRRRVRYWRSSVCLPGPRQIHRSATRLGNDSLKGIWPCYSVGAYIWAIVSTKWENHRKWGTQTESIPCSRKFYEGRKVRDTKTYLALEIRVQKSNWSVGRDRDGVW
jgi:hypothetical protein